MEPSRAKPTESEPVELGPVHPGCLNCGQPLTGPYCSACGQRDVPLHVTLGHLFREIAGDYFHIDSKLLRTLWALLSRPGKLTVDYLEGRREQFIRPFKVYLAASVAFFSWVALHPSSGPTTSKDPNGDEIERAFVLGAHDAVLESLGLEARGELIWANPTADPGSDARTGGPTGDKQQWGIFIQPSGGVRVQLGSARGAPPPDGTLAKRLEANSRDPKRVQGIVSHALVTDFPRAMFVMLPLFAALLRLVYVRRRWVYLEHFIFALHVHAFGFLALLLAAIAISTLGQQSAWAAGAQLGAMALIGIYAYLAIRRVYGQSRVKSALKLAMVGVTYLLVVSFALIGVILGAIYFA